MTSNAFCSSCGTQLAPDAAFCGRCGVAVGQAQSAEVSSAVNKRKHTPIGYAWIVLNIVVAVAIIGFVALRFLNIV